MDIPVIEICVITDSGYILPLSVMLTSAKQTKEPSAKYRIHVLHAGLSDSDFSTLRQLAEENFEMDFHAIDLQTLAKTQAKTHVSKTALAKFYLPDLLPNLDKVLYLDGDIIVRKDLTSLFRIELGNDYIAAVRDMSGDINKSFSKYTQIEKYINSGVLLMNLESMRNDNLPQKMVRLKAEAPPHWMCMDQDVINVACKGKVRCLPPCYNCMSMMWIDDYFTTLEVANAYYGTNYDSWLHMCNEATIIHYAGGHKPWKTPLCSHRDLWMYFYRLSPVAHKRLKFKLYLPIYLNPILKRPIFTIKPPSNEVPSIRLQLFNRFSLWEFNMNTHKKKILGCIPLPQSPKN